MPGAAATSAATARRVADPGEQGRCIGRVFEHFRGTDRVDSPEMRVKGLFVASLKMRAYAQWMGLTLAERRA
ncbi:hypothetical protein VT930_19830, partial [Mycobacterium sherrisii]|nr:hypothetical protein [Mycobacterium sherrisii]